MIDVTLSLKTDFSVSIGVAAFECARLRLTIGFKIGVFIAYWTAPSYTTCFSFVFKPADRK